MIGERLSIVIPTLNAVATLGATLACLPAEAEIIVVDGGSGDGTADIARAAGARFEVAPRGRGVQLGHGANAARRPWLLFLHADTVLALNWQAAVGAFIDRPAGEPCAAVFHLHFDDRGPWPRLFEWVIAWRTRWLGLPYGDQGLLITRHFYDVLGGYRPLPLMEDVDLVRRIGRGRLVMLDAVAHTSAARYRQRGYFRRAARNLFCLALFFLGVSPARIARLYER